MARLTRSQLLVLYALGQCYAQLNAQFVDKPLEISVSKIAFIEALLKSPFVHKKSRALYKNLETLEKKKLVVYENKQLRFTRRGFHLFAKLEKDVEPYILQHGFWKSPVTFGRKLQVHLRS